MDEEQEYEPFNVDGDFEGGEWIDDEYFYKSKRQKRGQTKDEQIYGIFAGDASTESDDEPHKRRGLGTSRRAKLTKPVGFVGGGVMKSKETSSPDHTSEISVRDGDNSGGANGLGFKTNLRDPPERENQVVDTEEEDFDLPSAFGRRIWETAKMKRQNASMSKSLKPGKASVEAQDEVPLRNLATFEAHTRGIGSRLLAKMGWKEGQGLGKEGRGISKPLEAKIRPKGMGMGYGDRREPRLEAKSTLQQKIEKSVDASSRAGGEGQPQREVKGWKKKRSTAPARGQLYKTVEELLEEQRKPVSAPSTVILDMRGPQTKVVDTLEQLHLSGKDESEMDQPSGPMPELQYNLRLLVSLAEADVRTLDARLSLERDTVEILNKEVQRLELECETNSRAAQRMGEFLSGIEKVQSKLPLVTDRNEGGGVNEGFVEEFERARLAFDSLRSRYPDEYLTYNGKDIVLGFALPGISRILSSWSPLDDPEKGSALFGAWKPLLGESPREVTNSSKPRTLLNGHPTMSADPLLFASSPDPLIRLAALVVLPPVHHDITMRWDPRNIDAMESFLACWKPHLPSPVLSYILSHLVMPKLRLAVDSWDPLSDPVAPHTWLHPWLVCFHKSKYLHVICLAFQHRLLLTFCLNSFLCSQVYLDTELADLWPKIRFKFSSALREWHPADDSAKVLLAPWRKAFGSRDWDGLMVRAIVPKLESALTELQINPAAQDLDPFEWVMKWADLLSSRHMNRLLQGFFFPKWFSVLRHWLSSTPDQQTLDDVTKWYLHWKSLFPDNILAQEGVKDALRQGLEMINRASCGQPLPTTWNAVPRAKMFPTHDVLEEAYGPAHEAPVEEEKKGVVAFFDDRPLRELVEQFAADCQVDFLPKMGRLNEGLQVYSFGLVSCTVDSARQSIWAQMGGPDRKSWIPVSMEQLLNEHKRRLLLQKRNP